MKYFLFFLVLSGITYVSCTDPVNIGTGLVQSNGIIDVDVTDTFSIKAKMVTGDSAITFRRLDRDGYSGRTYMFGTMEDDTFGRAEAVTYFNAHLFAPMPRFDTLTVDSIVMTIFLDTLGQYGNPQAIQNLELYRLTEVIPADNVGDTLFSNIELEHESTPLFTRSQVVNHRDSISIKSYTENDTLVKVLPQLRIPLDVQYWLDNAIALSDSTDFLENLNDIITGYAIKSTSDESSMIGLNLLYNSDANINSASAIRIYYQPTDTTKAIYNLRLGRLRHSYFSNDYSGSLLEQQLNTTEPEYLFLQSQAGAYLEFDLSAIEDIQDQILNFAGLELFLSTDDTYGPVEQLFAFYRNEDNDLSSIADLGTNTLSFFGGSLETVAVNGMEWRRYEMNITNQMNAFIDQDISSGKIFILPDSRPQRPQRSIILGPGNIEQPPVLKLVLSNP